MAAMEHGTYVKQMLHSNQLDPSVEKEEQVSIVRVTSVTRQVFVNLCWWTLSDYNPIIYFILCPIESQLQNLIG